MNSDPVAIDNPAPLEYARTSSDSVILKRGVPPVEFQPGVWLHLSSYRRGDTQAVIEVRPQQFDVIGEQQTVSLDQPLVLNGQKYSILALMFPDDRGAWIEIDSHPQP